MVRKDLKAKSRARIRKHLVSPSVKEKRFERSKKLFSLLKKRPTTILFSDEKLFTVDSVSNRRTNHFISHQTVQGVPEHVKYTLKTSKWPRFSSNLIRKSTPMSTFKPWRTMSNPGLMPTTLQMIYLCSSRVGHLHIHPRELEKAPGEPAKTLVKNVLAP